MNDDKILMVTGASSDIGTALIEKVAENYTTIIAHYFHLNDKLRELSRVLGEKLWLLQADFCDEQSVEFMLEQMRERALTVDHFVHMASGKVRAIPFRKSTWEEVERGINTSVKAAYMILQYVLHKMVKQKSGKVIIMLSSNVVGEPARNQSSYVIAKYGLLGLFRSLEAEYAERGIVFNAVSPDMIDTKFLTELPEIVLSQNRQNKHSRQNLQVEEVIPVFDFLLSEAGNVIKGQNISILNP